MLKKKPSRRQDKRKEINFLILNGTTLDRKRPHDDKVEHFVQSIISNQISNFGIKILSEIDLEIIQDFEESKYTFLQLAVYLGRDAIVAAFIRAGSKLFTTSYFSLQNFTKENFTTVYNTLQQLTTKSITTLFEIGQKYTKLLQNSTKLYKNYTHRYTTFNKTFEHYTQT